MVAEKWFVETLEKFGSSIGISELAPDERGVAQLEIKELGLLGLEQMDETVLISLSRTVTPDSELFANALELCHPSATPMSWVQAALIEENRLVFVTRLNKFEFDIHTVERTIEQLMEMFAMATEEL